MRRNQMWRDHAQCGGRFREFEIETNKTSEEEKQTTAEMLCAGCPVMAECAEDALERESWGTIRGGVWLSPRIRDRSLSKEPFVEKLLAVVGGAA